MLWLCLCALPATLWAQSGDDVSDDESAEMARTKQNAPVLQETDPTGANYFGERRALVGRHCAVNRVINVVSVGSGTSGLENLTNENIDDEAIFPSTAGITIAASPTVSVRDMKNYYAGGTTAGFCIVASSGSSVLNLDVIKTMHLWFYCDGKRVADQTVREGNAGSGVKLTLIGIPGDQESCVNLTAKCPVKFDEVALVQGGGLDVSVASALRVKYAFVGDPHDIYLTTSGIRDYCEANSLPSTYDVSCEAYMPSPLVGGIPLPVVESYRNRAIDDDLTNTVPLISAVQLASIAFKGNANVYAKNSDASASELFHKGDQVGFKYNFVQVADVLTLGTWVEIHLYDKQGNQVQNTTISAEALSLAIASGGDQTSYIVADQDFSGAGIYFYTALGVLNLGSGFGVYYGFVRPKAAVEHECTLNPTCNTNLCSNQSTHQLKANPDLNVTWTLISQPDDNLGACAVTADGFVTGMNADGPYTFRATAEDGCYEDITLNHGTSDDFLEPSPEHAFFNIDGEDPEYALSDDLHGETSANVLSISNMTNPDNVLNADLTDCAEYTAGLQLLGANGVIVGIKKLSEEDPYIYDGSKADALESIHLGFVVEMEQTNLGLSLLNAFQIRCFDKDGNRVYSSIVEDAGVVGLGLVGTNEKSQKLRLSITVPKVDGDGNPIKVNEIQLWKIGTIDLNVSDVKFYYGFWDDPSDVRNNIIRDGAYVVNYDNMGAIVNLGTQVNVASVGGVTNNLSNLIDIDDALETYALMQKTVEAGSTEIIVKLGRTVDFRHQVGVVVNNDIVGLNANVGSVLKVGTFCNGVETGEVGQNWGVLGANVIQGSGKQVLLVSPTADYDEIHITAGQGLAANRTIKLYGILLRNDVDHDGVPDNRDDASCNNTISNIEVGKTCVGGDISIRALGTTDTRYYVSFPDQNITKQAVQSDIDGWITGGFLAQQAGQYTMYFYDGSDNLLTTAQYTVHPLQTTWRTTTTSKDWNAWNNWTNGSPYLCTDVIIPAEARAYPSLDEAVTSANADLYGCDRIFFESRAAVEKVFKLNYTKAWVNVELTPERYYLLSAPLQQMVTGDMFVAKEQWPDNKVVYPTSGSEAQDASAYYFTALTGDNYWANRFAPRVYQRLWARAATNKLVTGSDEEAPVVNETQWSRHFNALSFAYGTKPFSAYVEPDGNAAETFTFRFPKEQTAYYYWNEATQTQSDIQETGIVRDDAATENYNEAYRFAFEAGETPLRYTYRATDDRALFPEVTTKSITVEADAATTTFLVPNPYMSHIDVARFLAANPDVTAVKRYDGNVATTAISLGDALLTTDAAGQTILPMEAFFVTVASSQTSLSVTFTEDMFYRDIVATEETEAVEPTRALVSGLSITAQAAGLSVSTLLLEGDDVPQIETLFEDEVRPRLALFTTQEGRALDVRRIESGRAMPLGIYTAADSVVLSFEALGNFDVAAYQLLDRQTGARLALDKPLTLYGVQGNAGRYVLVPADATGICEQLDAADELQVSVRDGYATISSARADLQRAEAVTTDGRIVSSATGAQHITLRLADGVNLLRITRADGTQVVRKVLNNMQ